MNELSRLNICNELISLISFWFIEILFKHAFGDSIFFTVRIPFFNQYVVSAMNHVIQNRIGHDRVRKEKHPILGPPIALNDHGCLQISFRHDFVKVFQLGGVQCH